MLEALAVCVVLLGTLGFVALQMRQQPARAKAAPRRSRRSV